MNNEIHELNADIKSNYNDTTQTCSNICRQIAFALMAVVWAMIFKNEYEHPWQVGYTRIILLLLVLYFFFDVLQYFVTAICYRKHYFKLREVLGKKKIEPSVIEVAEKIKREKINRISFRFFIFKIFILLLSVIGMICVVIGAIPQ